MKTIIIGILGLLKLFLDSRGIEVITQDVIDTTVTVVLGLGALVAILRDNIKRHKEKKAAKAQA
jgi:hypothetical protein